MFRLGVILKSVAVVIVALLVFGICAEQWGRHNDRKRLPQIGKSVDIGGRTLNILCSGGGGPPVIFESGGDGPGLEWEPMQTGVATFTQACWYDRAGIGWSDSGPYPRTSEAIARDLHELLSRAGVPPPYVLTGASFGGLNARIYAKLFPNEVAGLVLVDSAHEDESQRAPSFYLARTAPRFLWHPIHVALQAATFVGLLRLMEPAPPPTATPGSMSREELIAALRRQPKSIASNIATGVVVPESYAEARSVRQLGDLPLVVLTAGQPYDFGDASMNQQAAAYQRVWIHEMQAGLARLSTRGRQIVIADSNHGSIPADDVIRAVHDVVDQVRTANTRQ
jgi:pimeloyl-ACP methyl ester carboxylesterase